MNVATTRPVFWILAGILALLLACLVLSTSAAFAEQIEEPQAETPDAVEPDSGWQGGRGMRGGGCCGHCGGGASCCGGGQGMRGSGGMGRGMHHGGMRGGMGRGMAGHRSEMRNAHALIAAHDAIERRVEMLPDGIRTETTTDDPELVAVLQQHVAEMARLIEEGGRIRNWDPLFSTIFDHREAIRMEIENLPDGVLVTETSDDPRVAALIRAHADKVDDFVARGVDAYRESTPLPEDFLASDAAEEMGLPCWTGVG